jgi:predicted Zn-dependent protease
MRFFGPRSHERSYIRFLVSGRLAALVPNLSAASLLRSLLGTGLSGRFTSSVCTPFLLWRLMHVGLLAVLLSAPRGAFAQLPSELQDPARPISSAAELAEVRRRADELVKSPSDVQVRKSSADLSRLIDLLIKRGSTRDAERYLERLLRANPSAFSYQLTYGEVLAEKGLPEELVQRSALVLKHAEDDATLRRAMKLAGQPPPPAPPLLSGMNGSAPELVLVKHGDVSDVWLHELRDRLAPRLGIAVRVAAVDLKMGKPDRTGFDLQMARSRKRLLEAWERDKQVAAFLSANGLEKSALARSDEAVARAVRLLVVQSGEKSIKEVDDEFERLKRLDPQWKGDQLLRRVEAAVRPLAAPGRWFLAVTSHDIYTDDSNFLFGIAGNQSDAGVVSAGRFAAAFSGEVERRERLIDRLEKQALSSFGFMLGIGRCTQLECARSYPHNLEEHDAKPAVLCRECKPRLELALQRELPSGK